MWYSPNASTQSLSAEDRHRSEKQVQGLRLIKGQEAREPQAVPGDVNQLNAALKQLPFSDRELIVMSKYQGYEVPLVGQN